MSGLVPAAWLVLASIATAYAIERLDAGAGAFALGGIALAILAAGKGER